MKVLGKTASKMPCPCIDRWLGSCSNVHVHSLQTRIWVGRIGNLGALLGFGKYYSMVAWGLCFAVVLRRVVSQVWWAWDSHKLV